MISFIIPFRSDGMKERDLSFKYVHETLVKDWPDEEVIVMDSDESKLFNRSEARNWGAELARGDVLVFVDADSYVGREQIQKAVDVVKGWQLWAFPYDVYYSLSEWGTQQFFESKGAPFSLQYDYVFPGPDSFDRPAAVGGCIVVARTAFDEVCGYDERFIGWGFEDRAFVMALETLCGPEIRIPGPLYHLWHPEPEQDRFGQPHIGDNRDLYARYGAAKGDSINMRALVGEHWVC